MLFDHQGVGFVWVGKIVKQCYFLIYWPYQVGETAIIPYAMLQQIQLPNTVRQLDTCLSNVY